MLQELEKDNQSAVDSLIEAGYPKAAVKSMRITVSRVTGAQVEGREATRTAPGTRERQDALEKVSSAGAFFFATNGGSAMNTNRLSLCL